MVFYFFKVTLSYFDDEQKTFFITPDQSETDEDGIPFSENDLQNTPEFKEFAKTTKADIIDVDYIEYALEYDPKKSDILNKPVTPERFAELEESGQLEVVDENQFLLCLKAKKTPKGGGSKLHIICLIAAAVIVLGLLFASASGTKKGGDSESEVSSGISEVTESNEEDTSENSSEESSENISSTEEEISGFASSAELTNSGTHTA